MLDNEAIDPEVEEEVGLRQDPVREATDGTTVDQDDETVEDPDEHDIEDCSVDVFE